MDGWTKKWTKKWLAKGVHVWKVSICRPQEYTDSENWINVLNKYK